MDTSLLYYFALFVVASSVAIYKLNRTHAVAAAYMLGWLFLPSYVFQLAEMPKGGAFPFWVLGSSVPSLDWFSKAWFIPLVLLALSLLLDWSRFKKTVWAWPDVLMFCWCIWPLFQASFAVNQEPPAWLQSLYLIGSWGMPWILGRAYFSTAADQLRLIKVMALCCLLYLPVSLIEGIWGPFLHEFFFTANAFRYDGLERYFGFRPNGFLEHGNQFGAVIALTSIGAVWLARLAVGSRARLYRVQALILFLMMLAAQSVGAICLALLGIAAIFLWDRINAKLSLIVGLIAFSLLGLVYVLTADIGNWMWNSTLGQSIIAFMKSIGRSSFSWRLWADQAALSIVRDDIFFGTGHWAWWRQANIRPWGLPQVLVGQFGLVAVLVASVVVCSGAITHILGSTRDLTRQPRGAGLILSIVLILATLDALLNSFVYFPLFLISGGLASQLPTRILVSNRPKIQVSK
jgi:hypothetical protein